MADNEARANAAPRKIFGLDEKTILLVSNGIALLASVSWMIGWLIPVMIRSIYYVVRAATTIPPQFQPYVQRINAFYNEAMMWKAWAEIYVFFVMLFEMFGGGRGMIEVLVYYQIMRVRSMTNRYSVQAWNVIGQRVDMLINHQYCPSAIRFVVQKIKAYLTWMPQPRQQQQQQQQAQ